MSSRTASIFRAVNGLALAACLSLTALAGGCAGFDGVELQGGVFDAMGMTGSGQKKLSEVKVEPRPALVLPPSNDRLPEPVTGSIAAVPQTEAWPVDPEDRRAESKAALQQRHKEFCEREIQNARMRGDGGVITGPMGNCQPGMFGSLGKLIEGK